MEQWWIVKKKAGTRWTAYKTNGEPVLKRGYEKAGPYPSLIAAWIAADKKQMNIIQNERG